MLNNRDVRPKKNRNLQSLYNLHASPLPFRSPDLAKLPQKAIICCDSTASLEAICCPATIDVGTVLRFHIYIHRVLTLSSAEYKREFRAVARVAFTKSQAGKLSSQLPKYTMSYRFLLTLAPRPRALHKHAGRHSGRLELNTR